MNKFRISLIAVALTVIAAPAYAALNYTSGTGFISARDVSAASGLSLTTLAQKKDITTYGLRETITYSATCSTGTTGSALPTTWTERGLRGWVGVDNKGAAKFYNMTGWTGAVTTGGFAPQVGDTCSGINGTGTLTDVRVSSRSTKFAVNIDGQGVLIP